MKKMLINLFIAIAICYLLVCGLLYVLQERMIFYPEVVAPTTNYQFDAPFSEINLPVAGATLNALHFTRHQAQGIVLYFHGNAGSLRSWGFIATDFLAHGYDVLIFDYRGFGKSTGRIQSEAQLHRDSIAVYEYLRSRYPAEQILFYGRSIGTGLATKLATTHPPRLLILETPFVSFTEIAHRQFPFVPTAILKYHLPIDRWLAQISVPIYLIHGTDDQLIPHAASERLLPLITSPKALYSIRGGGHNNLSDFAAYHAHLRQVLKNETSGKN